MQQAETNYHLYADIIEWSYEGAHHAPDTVAAETIQKLDLYGPTMAFADRLTPPPLRLCLVCGDDYADYEPPFAPWLLDLLPVMKEPELPAALEAWLPLPEEQFMNLKECLFRLASLAECSVRVSLQVQENIGARVAGVAERSVAIVDFGYSLNFERSN